MYKHNQAIESQAEKVKGIEQHTAFVIRGIDPDYEVSDVKRVLIEILMDMKDQFPGYYSDQSMIEDNIGPVRSVRHSGSMFLMASEKFGKLLIQHIRGLIKDNQEVFKVFPLYIKQDQLPHEDEKTELRVYLPKEKVVIGGHQVSRGEWVSVLKTKIAILSRFGGPGLHECAFNVPRNKVGGVIRINFSSKTPVIRIALMKIILLKSYWCDCDDNGNSCQMDIIWTKKDASMKRLEKGTLKRKKETNHEVGGKVIEYPTK